MDQDKPFRPPADVYKSKEWVIVRLAIPDVIEDDIDIFVDAHKLIIRGFREPPRGMRPDEFLISEWHYGFFEKEVDLPCAVDCTQFKASYAEGTLTIRITV